MPEGKKAMILGASGLVGSHLLRFLLAGSAYREIVALVRQPLGITHPKLVEVITDFEHLHRYESYFQIDDFFSCLGTTLKKAKSKEAMFKIDVEYPLAAANVAKKMGARQCLLVSSLGANPHSSIFYSRIKGEL